jgi:hypothetical protein
MAFLSPYSLLLPFSVQPIIMLQKVFSCLYLQLFPHWIAPTSHPLVLLSYFLSTTKTFHIFLLIHNFFFFPVSFFSSKAFSSFSMSAGPSSCFSGASSLFAALLEISN